MKKFLSFLLAVILCIGTMAAGVSAVAVPEVYVTIANAGTLVAAQAPVIVTDIDADGSLTINDALYCAHEMLFEGGAAAGYASGQSQYGLSLNKLWGVENGGSYGYYVNDASAWSLTDPIKDGDYINAFVYTDLTAWSDAYAYFNAATAEAVCSQALTLTLSYNGYDANWNMVSTPCANAAVTANGEIYTADAEGKVTLSFDKPGHYVITAASDTITLVPPVCTVTVRSFSDTVGNWAADEIENGIASGLLDADDNGFEPKACMTRAALVQALYRLEGSPTVSGSNVFTDVAADSSYVNAVIWAKENGIINGITDASFAPDSAVTRQQTAVILWRYAVHKNYDVHIGDTANMYAYTDVGSISEYAVPAMQWACNAGLILGSAADTLDPLGSTAREQVAVILDRFIENIVR